MLDISIPGYGHLRLTDLVCDFNGTLAAAGELAPGVRERLPRLAGLLRIHVVTGDTFGTARAELAGSPCAIVVPYSDTVCCTHGPVGFAGSGVAHSIANRPAPAP